MRKPLLFVLLLVSAAWSAQRLGVLPFQDRVEDLGERVLGDVGGRILGLDSQPYAAFQEFATAMVRGDMEVVGRRAGQITAAQASQTYLGLQRSVRDVHQVAYRLEAEGPASDGKRVTLSVSQALTVDPVGTSSSFGTMACQGKYAATMTETATGWKVASFRVESSASRPERPLIVIVIRHGDSTAEWPCAESQWTAFGSP